MLYIYLKQAHIALALLSVTGFAIRAAVGLANPAFLRRRWVRTVPHVVDTLLLAAGVSLAVLYRFDPLEQPWLAAKLLALLLYIVLGFLALRRKPQPMALRVGAFLAAIAVFGYMLAAAFTKSAWPFA